MLAHCEKVVVLSLLMFFFLPRIITHRHDQALQLFFKVIKRHLKAQELIMIRVGDVSVGVDRPRFVVQVTHCLEQLSLDPALVCQLTYLSHL